MISQSTKNPHLGYLSKTENKNYHINRLYNGNLVNPNNYMGIFTWRQGNISHYGSLLTKEHKIPYSPQHHTLYHHNTTKPKHKHKKREETVEITYHPQQPHDNEPTIQRPHKSLFLACDNETKSRVDGSKQYRYSRSAKLPLHPLP